MDRELIPIRKAGHPSASGRGTELSLVCEGELASVPNSQNQDPDPNHHLRAKDRPTARPAYGQTARRKRPGVLVVDDVEMVRLVLEWGLTRHGFAVWSADNSGRAYQLYRDHRADIAVVLVDVSTPHMAGLTTLFALQQIDPIVRFCFMSGNASPYTEEDLLQLGALAIIRKPLRLDEVAQILWKLTDCSATAPP